MTISMNYSVPSVQSQNPSFKGKMTATDSGTPYYKTNNGAKVGATWGGIGILNAALYKRSIFGALLGLGIHYGVGSYIDRKRNQHAAEAADYINQVGAKKALETRKDIAVSSNNRLYYKSKDGVKYGTLIGAGTGVVFALLPATFLSALIGMSKNTQKFSKAAGIGATMLYGAGVTAAAALGGYILGRITDYYTNKSAEKHA